MAHSAHEVRRGGSGHRVRYQFLGAGRDGWVFRLTLEPRVSLSILDDGERDAREWVVPWATLVRSERMGMLDDLLLSRRLAEERQLLQRPGPPEAGRRRGPKVR